jgi:hypothetical protein
VFPSNREGSEVVNEWWRRITTVPVRYTAIIASTFFLYTLLRIPFPVLWWCWSLYFGVSSLFGLFLEIHTRRSTNQELSSLELINGFFFGWTCCMFVLLVLFPSTSKSTIDPLLFVYKQ